MDVQCATCRHFSLKESPLAHVRFGRCAFAKAWEFMSAVIQRQCSKHQEPEPGELAKRRAWLEGLA